MLQRVAASLLALIVMPSAAANPPAIPSSLPPSVQCGSLENAFGPFDWRTHNDWNKKDAENNHFFPGIESLSRNFSTKRIASELDYILRAYPNHTRALWTYSRLGAREGSDKPDGARYTIDCYFERAVRFQPDDGAVWLVLGLHLLRKREFSGAITALEGALELGENESNVRYHLGLAYFESGDHERALTQARRAYDLGFPLPGLRDKLKRAGKWRD